MSISEFPDIESPDPEERSAAYWLDPARWAWPQSIVDMDAPIPESQDARAWLDRLLSDLGHQRELLRRTREYHHGIQPLAFATQKFRETFGSLFYEQCDNWMDLVISATSERMRVAGIRMGDANVTTATDDAAWAMWQANGLDSESQIAHVDAMVCGVTYVLVGPQDDGSVAPPRITVEDPAQVVVRHAAGDRRKRLAGLKVYANEEGGQDAWVYLPESVHLFKRGKDAEMNAWAEDTDARSDNPLRVVPIVPMVCRPDARGHGTSDLRHVLSLQDEINKLTADIMVASEFASFRQRVVLGWDPSPDDDLISAASRLWTFNSSDVKVDEFSATDVRPLIAARESAIQRLAARTRTPPHYLLGQSGAFPSGESLKATETGLVAKVRERFRWFGEPWEESLRLGLCLQEGVSAVSTDSNLHRAEIVWADPESRSEGELVDSLVKMRTLGVPYEFLWEKYGASPQQIDRWRLQRGLPDDPPVGATGDRVTAPPDPQPPAA